MPDSDPQPQDRTEAFLQLLAEHETALGIYVTGLVGRPQDAQDILQEGRIVMWRHFDAFELGTNFPAWARKILFHQVLAWRRRSKKDSTVQLSEATLAALDQTMESAYREQRWVRREKALETCLQKLSDEHRQILQLRYRDEADIDKIAAKTNRSEGAIYRLLSRLRRTLSDCIDTTLEEVAT